MMIFESRSEKNTIDLAEIIADEINDFKIICLYGEMGSGKTTFTKAFAKKLGVKSAVTSPTYVLIRKHKTAKTDLYHIDAFRLEPNNSKKDIEEIFEDTSAIIIIEWAEKLKSILPKKRIDVSFILKKENDREIRVKKHFR